MGDQFSLRCYSYLDRMQPQYAAFVGTITQGDLPTEGMAALYIEVAPGNEVFRLVDIAVKATEAHPGAQVVERERAGRAVDHLAAQFDVDPLLLALVVAPIATELPEKFNSVLWVRQGKDTLAMGNITGAMVFQSTIPTVVALLFAADSWVIGPGSYVAFASAGIAFASSACIFIPMARSGRLHGRGLLVGGAFYLIYLAVVLSVVAGVFG